MKKYKNLSKWLLMGPFSLKIGSSGAVWASEVISRPPKGPVGIYFIQNRLKLSFRRGIGGFQRIPIMALFRPYFGVGGLGAKWG